MSSGLRIVFIGTPEFAVCSLEAMMAQGMNVVAVITAPDKPAGRGMQIQHSPVKNCAIRHQLPVLQPVNLKDPEFVETLRQFRADLQVVIAFRMLPEIVWNMPPLGTMNLHASLLPNYRGAAPINHAIIQGEKVTGVSTFLLKHEIDTGDLLLQEKVEIDAADNAGTLHDKLMHVGAKLVVKSVQMMAQGNYRLIPQRFEGNIKLAPKIHKEFCEIDWNQSAVSIRNHVRGLSPYPAARFSFQGKILKVFSCRVSDSNKLAPGEIEISPSQEFKMGTNDWDIVLDEVQWEGKRRMDAKEFLRGLKPMG